MSAKIRLLVGRSGSDGSHSPGDVIELPDKEAVRLVEIGSAEPVNKKAFENIVEKVRKAEDERKAIEEQNRIRLERETYELELESLYGQVVELEAALAGVRLTDEEKTALIEGLKNREDRTGNTAD